MGLMATALVVVLVAVSSCSFGAALKRSPDSLLRTLDQIDAGLDGMAQDHKTTGLRKSPSAILGDMMQEQARQARFQQLHAQRVKERILDKIAAERTKLHRIKELITERLAEANTQGAGASKSDAKVQPAAAANPAVTGRKSSDPPSDRPLVADSRFASKSQAQTATPVAPTPPQVARQATPPAAQSEQGVGDAQLPSMRDVFMDPVLSQPAYDRTSSEESTGDNAPMPRTSDLVPTESVETNTPWDSTSSVYDQQ